MTVLGDRILKTRLPEYYYKPLDYPQLEQRFLKQLEFVGHKEALLSTLRDYLPLDLTDSYREVGRQERPVLMLWGKHDRVIPFSNSAAVLEVLPQARLHPIDAGHVPPQEERREECNAQITSFLTGGDSLVDGFGRSLSRPRSRVTMGPHATSWDSMSWVSASCVSQPHD